MKEYKYMKKFREESIVYLWKYLNRKRKFPLNKPKEEAIKKLILEKHKENLQFSEELLSCPLFRLASMEMLKENKANITIKNNEIEFDCKNKPHKVIQTMIDIVNNAENKKQRKNLINYCEGKEKNAK